MQNIGVKGSSRGPEKGFRVHRHDFQYSIFLRGKFS